MGSAIEARELITDILNNNLLDPYPGTRKGINPKHFYEESDELILTRPDTFPKGYVTSEAKTLTKDGFGPYGHNTRTVQINVWYFVKEAIKYNDGTRDYKEKDYISYMINLIQQELMKHRKINGIYHIQSFGESDGPQINDEGSLKIYYDVVPVTIYWNEVTS